MTTGSVMMSLDFTFWLELIFKMAMTAAVVVFISIVVERSGPFIGAMIAALPTAAGAAYVILAIEHPSAFIAASAVGSMAIGAAVAIFAAVVPSLGVSLLAWFGCAALLRQFDWTPLRALALNAAVYAVTVPLSWRYRSSAPPRKFLRTRYDIPLRALAAATVVVIVTTASNSIGSFASGMFAVFPIVFCSSIVILHPRVGGKATASVMAHAQVALVGLTLAFMAVHYLAEPLGSWWALAVGLGLSVAWSGILMLVRRRMR